MNIKSKIFQMLGVDNLLDNAKLIVETRIELFKAQLQESVAEALSKIIPMILLMLVASSFLLFLSISLGYLLGEQLNSNFYGFGIVALFYLLLTIIIAVVYNSKSAKQNLKAKILDGMNRD